MDKGKPLKPKTASKDKAGAKAAASEAERQKTGEAPAKAAKSKK